MLEIKAQNENSPLSLIVTGDVSVSQIGELYADLLKVPTDAPEYMIQVKDVENLDLSFFQVLFAFARKIRANDGKLVMEWELGDEYGRIMKESGIQNGFDGLLSL